MDRVKPQPQSDVYIPVCVKHNKQMYASHNAEDPLLTTVGLDKKEVLQDVGFILPSDIIDFVMRQDKSVAESSFFSEGIQEVEKFWLNEQPDHIQRLRLQREEFASTLPICWHEDAVPHFQNDTATFYSWSTPLTFGGAWTSRNCFVGLPTSQMTKATRRKILQVLSWDMRTLSSGIRPEANHEGKPLTGKRLDLASKPLAGGWKGKFCFSKGDAEARWHAHDTGHDLV